jgi:hypothetical protein
MRVVVRNFFKRTGWQRACDQHDAWLKAGKTYRQMASELRRSAESDRRGSGRKPLPGMARGEPNEFSFQAAARQDRMAEFFEQKAAAGGKYVTEEDIQEAHRLAGG